MLGYKFVGHQIKSSRPMDKYSLYRQNLSRNAWLSGGQIRHNKSSASESSHRRVPSLLSDLIRAHKLRLQQ